MRGPVRWFLKTPGTGSAQEPAFWACALGDCGQDWHTPRHRVHSSTSHMVQSGRGPGSTDEWRAHVSNVYSKCCPVWRGDSDAQATDGPRGHYLAPEPDPIGPTAGWGRSSAAERVPSTWGALGQLPSANSGNGHAVIPRAQGTEGGEVRRGGTGWEDGRALEGAEEAAQPQDVLRAPELCTSEF